VRACVRACVRVYSLSIVSNSSARSWRN